MSEALYVHYGCGLTAPAGWLNFDASPTLRWERMPLLGRLYTKNAERFPAGVRYGDIVRGLPIPEGSCKGIYASHVLEHLALNDFHRALENTRRMLAPGGIFRLVVPDLECAARQYLSRLDSGDATANSDFLRETLLGEEQRVRGFRAILGEVFGNSRHRWMWDEPSLADALRSHGFVSIRRCRFGDSEDPMFQRVEERSRFEQAVAMEARG